MPRTFSITSLTTAALAAALFAPPALSQGALKPVDALIVNPPSRPVPVSIVTPAAPATAMCRIDFTGSNTLPVTRAATSFPIAELNCTGGVSRLDVHRVVVSTRQFPLQMAPVHFNVIVGLGSSDGANLVIDTPIATLSSGTPDLALARPVRIDKTAATLMLAQEICSSGIAGIPVNCLGTVFLIGTAVN